MQTSTQVGAPSLTLGAKSANKANASHTPDWAVVVASLNWCLKWLQKWGLVDVSKTGSGYQITLQTADGWTSDSRGLVLMEKRSE